jgi:hypothetical protein
MFQFYPTNHSVIRAAYGYPCIPYDYVATASDAGNMFDSGFQPIAAITDNVRRSVLRLRVARTYN